MATDPVQQLVDRALDAILYTIGDQEDGTPNVALFRQRGRIRSVLVQFGIALTESNNSRPAPTTNTNPIGTKLVVAPEHGLVETCSDCGQTHHRAGDWVCPKTFPEQAPVSDETDTNVGVDRQERFAESREGMVSVHDHTGKCIGSMGAEFWARATDAESCKTGGTTMPSPEHTFCVCGANEGQEHRDGCAVLQDKLVAWITEDPSDPHPSWCLREPCDLHITGECDCPRPKEGDHV